MEQTCRSPDQAGSQTQHLQNKEMKQNTLNQTLHPKPCVGSLCRFQGIGQAPEIAQPLHPETRFGVGMLWNLIRVPCGFRKGHDDFCQPCTRQGKSEILAGTADTSTTLALLSGDSGGDGGRRTSDELGGRPAGPLTTVWLWRGQLVGGRGRLWQWTARTPLLL